MSNSVIWFRRDLRLADNPALIDAAANGDVTPLFVLDPIFLSRSGAPRLAFLFRNLRELNKSMGGALVVRTGDPVLVVAQVAREVSASHVYIGKDFAPYGQRRDAAVGEALAAIGIILVRKGSPYAVDPGTVRKSDGTPYAVFTPFSKIWIATGWAAPQSAPRVRWRGAPEVSSEKIPDDPNLLAELPEAGETAAAKIWSDFRASALDTYRDNRNSPGIAGTSMLSPYLRFGVVHPRQLLADLGDSPSHATFRSELGWREFYADVLFNQPRTAWHNLQTKMDKIALDTDANAKKLFAAWCLGQTGYPIVDAGIRQMLATGWMHNRVRMIVASFLVKDLHLPWQWGARFFMQHLVDGDIASNNHGWQWTAGTGTDASPYFRIFNPISQGEKFDQDGAYVRRWVSELRDAPAHLIHAPWLADSGSSTASLFDNYTAPIVDHAHERAESLARYKLVSTKQSLSLDGTDA
jgi:deoxyribodipyrimidine photo-lyase